MNENRLFMWVVFLVCVAAAAFAIVRNPEVDFLQTFINGRTAKTPSSDAASLEETAGTTATAGRSAATRASRTPVIASKVPDLAPSSSERLESPFLNVLTDSVPVYSSNSADGNVLKLLREGDPVEPGVQVLSPEGWWVEVRLDEETSGFMRSESLGRK